MDESAIYEADNNCRDIGVNIILREYINIGHTKCFPISSLSGLGPCTAFINISQPFLFLLSFFLSFLGLFRSYRTKKAHISAPDNTLLQSKR